MHLTQTFIFLSIRHAQTPRALSSSTHCFHTVHLTLQCWTECDIISLPTTRRADITGCQDSRGAKHTDTCTSESNVRRTESERAYVCQGKHSPAPAWRIPCRSSMLQPTGHSTDCTAPSWWVHPSNLNSDLAPSFYFTSSLSCLLASRGPNTSHSLVPPLPGPPLKTAWTLCQCQQIRTAELQPAASATIRPSKPLTAATDNRERWYSSWHPPCFCPAPASVAPRALRGITSLPADERRVGGGGRTSGREGVGSWGGLGGDWMLTG